MMMSIYGRHELVPRGPASLRSRGEARSGRDPPGDQRQPSRRDRRGPRTVEPAPPDAASGTDAISAALAEVVRAGDGAAENDDTLYAGPRAASIASRACASLNSPSSIRSSTAPARAPFEAMSSRTSRAPECPAASRLWRVLTAHFVDELDPSASPMRSTQRRRSPGSRPRRLPRSTITCRSRPTCTSRRPSGRHRESMPRHWLLPLFRLFATRCYPNPR